MVSFTELYERFVNIYSYYLYVPIFEHQTVCFSRFHLVFLMNHTKPFVYFGNTTATTTFQIINILNLNLLITCQCVHQNSQYNTICNHLPTSQEYLRTSIFTFSHKTTTAGLKTFCYHMTEKRLVFPLKIYNQFKNLKALVTFVYRFDSNKRV